jgi:hypothetical protein
VSGADGLPLPIFQDRGNLLEALAGAGAIDQANRCGCDSSRPASRSGRCCRGSVRIFLEMSISPCMQVHASCIQVLMNSLQFQTHVHGDARRSKDQQQNGDIDNVGRVPGRPKDPRRVLKLGSQQVSKVDLDQTDKRMNLHCAINTNIAAITRLGN